jgi:hypothetical protein
MSDDLNMQQRAVFGVNATLHPVTGMPLENGIGHLSDNAQAELHCRQIDREQGRAAGNEMRRKCGLTVVEDVAEVQVQPKGE